jgi:serine protease Do
VCKVAPAPVNGSSALVEVVSPNSPGARAGVKAGDILLQVGDHPIAAPEDVLDASFFIVAEDDVKLRLARNASQLEVSATAIDVPRILGQPAEPTDFRGAPVKLER